MVSTDVFNSFSLEGVEKVNVLVVEQDEDYISILKAILSGENFNFDVTISPEEALENLENSTYELIILNANLNKLANGQTVLSQIRSRSISPVITLVDENEAEAAGLALLEEGADYDLVKPFTPQRLKAAVTAALRRNEVCQPGPEGDTILPDFIKTGGLELSLGRLEANVNNKKINLSAREFSLLQFLMTNPNRIFAREELAARAWGWSQDGEIRAIDSTIKRLRNKIEDDTRHPRFILTERNEGYLFNAREGSI
jgi:two-component system response regulator VicR